MTSSRERFELRVTVVTTDAREHDVVVSAPPGATVAELTRMLGEQSSAGGELGLWCERRGEQLVAEDQLAACGLRWGDRLALRPATREPTRVGAGRGMFELVVTSGPCAGENFELGAGTFVVGREPGIDVCIEDPSMSRRHLEVVVGAGNVAVSDMGSSNGTAIGGLALAPHQTREIRPEDELELGRSLVRIRPVSAAAGTGATQQRDGRLDFNRPPRVSPPRPPWSRELGPPPERARKAKLPLAASLVPLGAGLLLFALLRSPVMLAVAALSPMMALGTYVSDRRGGKKSFGRESKRFAAQLADALAAYAVELRAEAESRRAGLPDAPTLLRRLEETSPALWERRPENEDFLSLRVGVADLPPKATLTLRDGGEEELRKPALAQIEQARRLTSVPLTLELGRLPIAGIVGPYESVRGLARWLLLQGAALHSPGELVLVACLSQRGAEEWEWLKWLGHVRPDRLGLESCGVAVGRAECEQLLGEVRQLVADRRERMRAVRGVDDPPTQLLLVIEEEAAVDRSLLGAALAGLDSCGVSVLWLGGDRHKLPGLLDAIVELEQERRVLTLTEVGTGEVVADVNAEGVPVSVAERAARLLAPLRDVSELARGGEIPRRVGLLELLDMPSPSAEALERRWRGWDGRVSATVGVGAEGPMVLDLRSEGPHALIAGTTGSGKSELLRTFVAGAAADCPPDRLTFLLVDYKGGAAFAPCAALPHVVDLVSDLDEHLAERALTSLDAELKRRERILAQHGARDLQELIRRAPKAAPPLLVIAVDEFAKLREEVPEFVDGVVDIAQRGRSLGVHMVLAAQTLRNAFTPAIRANTNLRIALRVADEAESEDVIDSPLAARIPSGETFRGRAFARTGHGELREFQAAYVSGRTEVEDADGLLLFDFDGPISARSPSPQVDADSDLDTDLVLLGAAATEAQSRMALSPPTAPWLPTLPATLDLDRLADAGASVAIGLVDLPAQQRQDPLTLDLAKIGHIAVFGGPNSGKSTALTTAALALARSATSDELAIYALDCGSGALAALEELPHCGGVVRLEEEERVGRLLRMLLDRVEDRAGPLELHRTVVLLLDDLGAFSQTYDRPGIETPAEQLLRILAGGRAAGVHAMLTASRRAALPSALAAHVGRRLVLRMPTEEEMLSLGLESKRVRGAKLSAGRGFTQDSREFQIAVPLGADHELGLAAAAARVQGDPRAVPAVRTLPRSLAAGELPTAAGPDAVPIGLRDRDLEVATVDLSEMHMLVAGPYRSGRSSALATLAAGLRRALPEADLQLLSPRRNALRELTVWSAVSAGAQACGETVRAVAEQLEQDRYAQARSYLFIDDGGELTDPLVIAELERVVRLSRDSGPRVIAAVESSSARGIGNAWIRELRREGHGLLLQPDLAGDGDVLGARLPRRVPSLNTPGRGFLVVRGSSELVQLAV